MSGLPTAPTIRRMRVAIFLLVAILTASCASGPGPDATGEEIYVQLCARCHGEDLGGVVGPALGAGSGAVGRTDEYLIATITNGLGSMPSYRRGLEPDQIERVVAYMRERQSG